MENKQTDIKEESVDATPKEYSAISNHTAQWYLYGERGLLPIQGMEEFIAGLPEEL